MLNLTYSSNYRTRRYAAYRQNKAHQYIKDLANLQRSQCFEKGRIRAAEIVESTSLGTMAEVSVIYLSGLIGIFVISVWGVTLPLTSMSAWTSNSMSAVNDVTSSSLLCLSRIATIKLDSRFRRLLYPKSK